MTVPVALRAELPTIAIEPVELNALLLGENVRLNELTDRVLVVQAAVGDSPGTARIRMSRSSSGKHRVAPGAGSAPDVEVTTIDSLVREHDLRPPYLIKIDTQGYDVRVLQGARTTLMNSCFVIAEIWPLGMRKANSGLQDLDELVTEYELAVYEYHQGVLRPIADVKEFQARGSGGSYANLAITNQPSLLE